MSERDKIRVAKELLRTHIEISWGQLRETYQYILELVEDDEANLDWAEKMAEEYHKSCLIEDFLKNSYR